MWRTSKARGQFRAMCPGVPHRWQITGIALDRWVSTSIGVGPDVVRRGGGEVRFGCVLNLDAVGIGLGALLNAMGDFPKIPLKADGIGGIAFFVAEALKASLAIRFSSNRRAASYHPSASVSSGRSVLDSAILFCIRGSRPRRNLITIAMG